MFDTWMEHEPKTITLHASALASKYGFNDGNLYKYDREELIKLVKHFLLPELLPTLETHVLSTCHNPIRCEAEFKGYCESCGISVTISVDEADEFLAR